MTVIDMHAHIAYYPLLHRHFLHGMQEMLRRRAADEHGVLLDEALLRRLATRRLNDPDCQQLLAEMDAAGIATTVLLIADFGFGHEDDVPLSTLYEHYHRVMRAHPDRFIVFGGSDPRRGDDAVAMFEYGLRDLGFRGLKLYAACGYEIDDHALFAYYELCEAYNVPVLMHTGPSLPTMVGDCRYPKSILRVARQFPHVRFILGHAAFQDFDTNIGVASARPNVYLETSGFQRLVDRGDQVKGLLRTLFDRIPNQVVFGTDWPVYNVKASQREWVAYFDSLGVLSDAERAQLFRENARAALGIAAPA